MDYQVSDKHNHEAQLLAALPLHQNINSSYINFLWGVVVDFSTYAHRPIAFYYIYSYIFL